MRKRDRLVSAFWLSAAGFVLVAASLWACSVPVFRYALERWPSDPYQATVFHRGPMTEAQQVVAKDLTQDGQAGKFHSNISLRTVDLDRNPDPESLALWEQSKGGKLPWLVLHYPQATKVRGIVWSGPLGEAAVSQVLDSPARKEIVRRLAEGESVVWALLETGDKQKDDEAAKLVESRLTYLASVMKLPKIEKKDLLIGAEDQLRLAFSVVRVSRKDSAEQAFVNMLLGSEPDLREITEPLAFPIFGRGRVLYALAGKGITHENIDQASSFLIGACSCEVKERNPGVDLLISADWNSLIKETIAPDRDLPSLASLTGAGADPEAKADATAVEVVSFRPSEKAAPRRPKSGSVLLIGGLAIAGLVAAGVFLRRRA